METKRRAAKGTIRPCRLLTSVLQLRTIENQKQGKAGQDSRNVRHAADNFVRSFTPREADTNGQKKGGGGFAEPPGATRSSRRTGSRGVESVAPDTWGKIKEKGD